MTVLEGYDSHARSCGSKTTNSPSFNLVVVAGAAFVLFWRILVKPDPS